MSKISKELNSILNEEKEYINEDKSPALFIITIILFVSAIYFFVLYFTKQNNTNANKTIQATKIIKSKEIRKEDTKQTLKKEKTNLKEKVISEEKINKASFQEIYNSSTSNSLKCYDYTPGDFSPSSSCLSNLEDFANKNKEALRYQVIAVVAQSDINTYKEFKENIKQLIINGLSIKRVSEITWNLKKNLGNDIIVTSNNYYVKSKKNNRGIILKAYY